MEDIREGIAEIFCSMYWRIRDEKPYALHSVLLEASDITLKYLHDNDVVMKVDRELSFDDIGWLIGEDGIVKSIWSKNAGYVAVEPLIEE